MEGALPSPELGSYPAEDQGGMQEPSHQQLMAYAADLSRAYKQLRETQERLEEVYLSTLGALVAAIEARDSYLDGHSRSVMAYALAVGQAMALSPERLESLRRAALLHDIGKIGLPDSVLQKAGPLDEAEWLQIRRHPELGYHVLSSLAFLGEALPGIQHHHERYDGRGYPSGLEGEGIPLLSRILAACDAFDAMTSNRIYRPAMMQEKAIGELRKGRGGQFDPRVADLLAEVVSEGKPAPAYLTSTSAILSRG